MREDRLVAAMLSAGVRDRRALRVILHALLRFCGPPAAKCLNGHKMEPDAKERNWCDVCNVTGTSYHCHADGASVRWCDYDLCADCYNAEIASASRVFPAGWTAVDLLAAADDRTALELLAVHWPRPLAAEEQEAVAVVWQALFDDEGDTDALWQPEIINVTGTKLAKKDGGNLIVRLARFVCWATLAGPDAAAALAETAAARAAAAKLLPQLLAACTPRSKRRQKNPTPIDIAVNAALGANPVVAALLAESVAPCGRGGPLPPLLPVALDGTAAAERELVCPMATPEWVGTAAGAEAVLATLKALHETAMQSAAPPRAEAVDGGAGGGCCGSAGGGLAVGCDTEWATAGSAPALVQLAVHGRPAWLVDTQLAEAAASTTAAVADGPVLRNEPARYAAAVRELLGWLFSTAGVRLLGFAFKSDLAKLAVLTGGSLPLAREDGAAPVIDIQRCAMGRAGYDCRGQTPGLKRVVETWLPGYTIDKAEQCSEWGERPLTDSQLRYAAVDAEVLVALDLLLHGKISN